VPWGSSSFAEVCSSVLERDLSKQAQHTQQSEYGEERINGLGSGETARVGICSPPASSHSATRKQSGSCLSTDDRPPSPFDGLAS
jgi:hypothetical protein